MSRKELRDLIPHGYCGVIAKRAGVSRRSVSLFMKEKSNSRNIEIATLNVLAELNAEKSQLLEKIK